ncbi:actin cytoskeleton-regulatory complex pan-like protein [Trema orientale]|uniref:Actin cytoskeleton-regulatory complex pan-like protein n=1 Tax=Trema orientale TaxID=63057 RepID=A0A2P5F2H6_TREOI|nr:actin cytoskeleton-regulatory complex pan-like protein [Trema orientale]
MKIPGKPNPAAAFPATLSTKALNPRTDSDLLPKPSTRKPARRKPRTPGFGRVKRAGVPAGRRSRPETPLLKWKIEDEGGRGEKDENEAPEEDERGEDGRRAARKGRRGREGAVSARKLAAGLWRLHSPEMVSSGGQRSGQLGFQPPGVGHVGLPFVHPRSSKAYVSEAKDYLQSPSSSSRNGMFCKLQPSFQFSNSAMEGITKWDPVCLKTSDEALQIYRQMKLLDQQVSAVSVVSALETELEQAHARIQDLETERRSLKKKFDHFLRKVSEEKASWRSREHEKIRAFIDDLKAELNRERKNRQRIEILNSKLVNELADAKLSAKRFLQDYEKERKARELIEEVCDELAKEIEEDKVEVETLKRESMKLREEVDEERKMLQMAEVWREERVQMKLVDAKVAVEEKYSHMNKLVSDLEKFLISRSTTPDVKEMREAELLRQAATSVNIQEIKDFSYEPPNPDDIFSVFEEVNFGEPNEREIEPCVAYSPASHASRIHTVSPEVNGVSKSCIKGHITVFADHNGDIEEEESGWETASHVEDQGSSYSPEGSAPSVNKNHRDSNVSGSGTEWEDNVGEETPITEISEVCLVPTKQFKKGSSITRLWRSCSNNGENYKIISVEGINGRLSNGRLSNTCTMSPDRASGKGGFSPSDLPGQWSSPDSGNSHIRGMKGCIPRSGQKNSLKSKLLEARMESQKVQLRHVLKQKI